jgi:hypothetical protein
LYRPCPNWAHTQLAEGTAYDKGVYANDNEYLDDLGHAVRSEILALYDAGWYALPPNEGSIPADNFLAGTFRLMTRW